MESLFVETKNGNIPIDKEMVEKYRLKEGTFTPFSHQRIVDENGNFIHDKPFDKNSSLKNEDDEIKDLENGLMLSTSEMIDISEGADSYPDENQDDS